MTGAQLNPLSQLSPLKLPGRGQSYFGFSQQPSENLNSVSHLSQLWQNPTEVSGNRDRQNSDEIKV